MDDTFQTLDDHDKKEYTSLKQRKRNNKTIYQFFNNCRKCSSLHDKKQKKCFSNCSTINQFLILLLPIAHSLSTILIIRVLKSKDLSSTSVITYFK